MFGLLEDHLDILYKRSCKQKMAISRLQKWILESFPHSGINLISKEEEEILTPAGDALLVRKCKQELDFKINFNRSVG